MQSVILLMIYAQDYNRFTVIVTSVAHYEVHKISLDQQSN